MGLWASNKIRWSFQPHCALTFSANMRFKVSFAFKNRGRLSAWTVSFSTTIVTKSFHISFAPNYIAKVARMKWSDQSRVEKELPPTTRAGLKDLWVLLYSWWKTLAGIIFLLPCIRWRAMCESKVQLDGIYSFSVIGIFIAKLIMYYLCKIYRIGKLL